jgi:hypothetical protein
MSHTVNVEQQHNTKMKNKTLLIAAAALVAGVISSEAQVYSANIVGYVNVALPGAAAYSLVATPLDDGNGNQSTNLLAGLPVGSSVTTWNGAGYNPPIALLAGGWAGNVSLPPGTAYFVKNGKASSPNYTNVFVGTVGAVGLTGGSTMTNVLGLGYNLVGSQIAFAGDVTTDPNLNLPAAKGSSITTWAGAGYNVPVSYVSGAWAGSVPITPGQGFFMYQKFFGTNWVQTLP